MAAERMQRDRLGGRQRWGSLLSESARALSMPMAQIAQNGPPKIFISQ